MVDQRNGLPPDDDIGIPERPEKPNFEADPMPLRFREFLTAVDRLMDEQSRLATPQIGALMRDVRNAARELRAEVSDDMA